MEIVILSLCSCFFYCCGMILQLLRYLKQKKFIKLVAISVFLGMLFHATSLYILLHSMASNINFGVFNILSLSTLLMTLIVWLFSLKKTANSLFLIILPITMVSVLLAWLIPISYIMWKPSLMMIAHIVLSIMSYVILFIAACQALLIMYKEKQLKSHHSSILIGLPPLQTMENILFDFIKLGMMLLTLALVSGFFFIEDIFDNGIIQKTILSVIAWALFAILLIGRKKYGWRGQTAIRWTLSGLLCLMIAYFSWQFFIQS